MKNLLKISDEVSAALRENRPVVALETTIISHGMPYPQNVETALAVEEVIRSEGAIPATIGVIGGKLIVGMSPDEIEYMGREGQRVRKLSRRDLAACVSQKADGATTCASTSLIAHMAGIRVFATGGLGGVHRNGSATLDISADLDEMGRTPVMIVCAGPKAILDTALTLEYLETKGVAVVGYRTDKLPAFYSSESFFGVDYRLDTPAEIAAMMNAQTEMGLSTGILVCNPIPKEHEVPREVIEPVIEDAVREAEALGIKGKETTPFLLARIKDITSGRSLTANIALVKNNAKLAAQIAREMCNG